MIRFRDLGIYERWRRVDVNLYDIIIGWRRSRSSVEYIILVCHTLSVRSFRVMFLNV